MTKGIITAIVLVAIAAGIYGLSGPAQSTSKKVTEKTGTEAAMVQEVAPKVLAGTSAPLLEFTKTDYDKAISSGKLVVLYFYANWCPLCKAEFPEAIKTFNGLTTDKVVGFRVNYNDSDTDADEVAIARQFGVAYQHTKVFVKDGKVVLKSPESWDAARYGSEIAKALN